MTKEQFRERFEMVKINVFQTFFSAAPFDTGKLRASIRLVEAGDGSGSFYITIDAPYTEYTNEKGKSAGWIDRAMQDAFNMIVREMMTE